MCGIGALASMGMLINWRIGSAMWPTFAACVAAAQANFWRKAGITGSLSRRRNAGRFCLPVLNAWASERQTTARTAAPRSWDRTKSPRFRRNVAACSCAKLLRRTLARIRGGICDDIEDKSERLFRRRGKPLRANLLEALCKRRLHLVGKCSLVMPASE